MHPFASRAIAFHGVHQAGDWRVKRYSVAFDNADIDWSAFAPGVALAEAALPQPAATAERIGVALLIAHQGRTGNYAVMGWWDRENELPLRVFVSPDKRRESWRPSEGSESICIWDLEVLWAEREAYVATMLRAQGGDLSAYLALTALTTPR